MLALKEIVSEAIVVESALSLGTSQFGRSVHPDGMCSSFFLPETLDTGCHCFVPSVLYLASQVLVPSWATRVEWQLTRFQNAGALKARRFNLLLSKV
jgi:hypothetical protein